MCLSIYVSMYLSIHSSIYRSIDLSIYPTIDLSAHPSAHHPSYLPRSCILYLSYLYPISFNLYCISIVSISFLYRTEKNSEWNSKETSSESPNNPSRNQREHLDCQNAANTMHMKGWSAKNAANTMQNERLECQHVANTMQNWMVLVLVPNCCK